MRKARVLVSGREAGLLYELIQGKHYKFEYLDNYSGPPVSLTMPVSQKTYEFNSFPPYFDGLLPEGYQLEALLKIRKIDRNDMFAQLLAVGDDMIGNITVYETDANHSNSWSEEGI